MKRLITGEMLNGVKELYDRMAKVPDKSPEYIEFLLITCNFITQMEMDNNIYELEREAEYATSKRNTDNDTGERGTAGAVGY